MATVAATLVPRFIEHFAVKFPKVELFIDEMKTAFSLKGHEVFVGASVGIALSAESDDADELLRNADLAMYRAKRSGRGRHVEYHEGLHDEVVSRFRMEGALQRALESHALGLAHQPIVDVLTDEHVGWIMQHHHINEDHNRILPRVPEERTMGVVAFDSLGNETGRDELTVNGGGERFWFRIAEPGPGVAAGATITMPMEEQFWGDRYGQLRDPFGHSWSIGGPANP